MLLDLLSSLGAAAPPAAPTVPVFVPARPRRFRERGHLTYRLVAAGRARTSSAASAVFGVTLGGSGRSRAAGVMHHSTTRSMQPKGTRGSARAAMTVATSLRCADLAHLHLPLPLHDLLFESWET
jgi:hypothetical protein